MKEIFLLMIFNKNFKQIPMKNFEIQFYGQKTETEINDILKSALVTEGYELDVVEDDFNFKIKEYFGDTILDFSDTQKWVLEAIIVDTNNIRKIKTDGIVFIKKSSSYIEDEKPIYYAKKINDVI